MSHRLSALACALSCLAHASAFAEVARPIQVAATELSTVVVTHAEPEAFENRGIETDRGEAKLTPGGVTLVGDDMLYTRNVASLPDLLRYVPGVWTASHSGSESIFISSRGSNLDATDFDRNGVKLFQDGLPVTTADGNNHNRIIDPLSARYAIVARGANGMKYGASTLGGAIDFISPTAHDSAAELFFNGGSHGQAQARATVSQVFNDRFDGLVTLEHLRRDGYRDHDASRRTGVYGNAGWKLTDDIGTRFYVTQLARDLELPGQLTRQQVRDNPDQASADAIRGNFQANLDATRIANKSTWKIDANRRFDIGFSYEQQDLYHPVVASALPFFRGLLIDTEHRDFGAMARYSHKAGAHDLLFGANYGVGSVKGEHYGNAGGVRDGLARLIDQRANNLELFAMDRWRFADAWTLVPALQVVRGTRDVSNTPVVGVATPVRDTYSGVNPSLGLIRHLSPASEVYASVSRLYEPPTTFELADDIAGGGRALDAMHGVVAEIGTRGNRALGVQGNWDWDVSAYYARIRDEILSIDNPAAPGTSLSTNIDRTLHAGIETSVGGIFALDVNGTHSVAPRLALTVNHFKFDGDATYGDNRLPAAPRFAVRGEVLYRHANGFYIGPTFDVIGKRYADFANRYEIDGYELLGLLAGWSNDTLRVFLELRNLTDEDYIATHRVRDVARANDALLNPGEPFSAYIGVQYKF